MVMDACPRCGLQVDQLHPVPPGVVSRELVEVMGEGELVSHFSTCRWCIRELMEEG